MDLKVSQLEIVEQYAKKKGFKFIEFSKQFNMFTNTFDRKITFSMVERDTSPPKIFKAKSSEEVVLKIKGEI